MSKKYFGWRIFDYWQWLLDQIGGYLPNIAQYNNLLSQLHSMPFAWILDRDASLAWYGQHLRIEFMDEKLIPDLFYKDEITCSVLEMLIALAIKADHDMVGSGNPGFLFWKMIENLGLLGCTDDNFDPNMVQNAVRIWLTRAFEPNGNGSPFPLNTDIRDQRRVDIWSQMAGWVYQNITKNTVWG